jgi:hypothetical protein
MDWPDIWLLLVVVSTRWPPLAPKKESADNWLSPSVLSALAAAALRRWETR